MRLDQGRESSNVEDRRGQGTGGGGFPIGGRSIGIGAVVLALVAMYFGVDPSVVLNMADTSGPPAQSQQGGATSRRPPEDAQGRFVSMVLADTEETWGELFKRAGKTYSEPKLVLYSGATQSGCGVGQAAMGPFYCPLDRKLYIDLSFYRDLQTRFKAPGDFAQAYVIAHEIGHHVQNLLGIAEEVRRVQSRAGERQGNQLQVRMELQADCFAGIWAAQANRNKRLLEPGDIEEGLRAAAAVGDDRIQMASRGYVSPESFTHGSSEQRMRWFRRGLETGDLKACDTFRAGQL